jgi:hypothetical protein
MDPHPPLHPASLSSPRNKGGCNVIPSPTDMSPTENSWMLHPLDKVSLGYYAPDRTIPSLNTDFLTALHCALCAVHVLCSLCVTRSRVGTHRTGAQYERDALFKGRNIQELSVGDTSTLHPKGGVHTRRAERGMGGSIFWKMREI